MAPLLLRIHSTQQSYYIAPYVKWPVMDFLKAGKLRMVRVQAIRRIFCAQNRCPEFSFLNTPNFYSIPALCLGNTTPLPRVWAAESSTQAWSCVLSTQTITLHKPGKVPSNFLARTTIHNQAGTHLPLQDGTSLTHQTTTYNFFPDKATSPSASTNTR